MKTHTQEFIRKRRFFMMLPLLTVPFVTMIFWALGGGQATPAQATPLKAGFNLDLPDAHFLDDEPKDKLALYEQAKRDSAKHEEFNALQKQALSDNLQASLGEIPKRFLSDRRDVADISSVDANEERVNRKLQEIMRELDNPSPVHRSQPDKPDQFTAVDPDIARLETLLRSISEPGEPDPEMQQINGVLEKILDIQHPERVAEKGQQKRPTQAKPIRTATTYVPEIAISTLTGVGSIDSTAGQATQNFFFADGLAEPPRMSNVIHAVVYQTQTIVDGSTIRLRLTEAIKIQEHTVQKDVIVTGTCSIKNERLLVTVNVLRDHDQLLSVTLAAFDVDGMEGLYIPGAIGRDISKQSSDQAVQSMQLMGMDPSWSGQAAAAGIEAAKGFFGKKVKLVRITVKAGHHILLKNPENNTY